MKTDPGDITGLQDIIQSYETKGPDSWSNLKDQRARHVKPKGAKVFSRPLIHLKHFFSQISSTVAIISKTSITVFMAFSSFQRSFYEFFNEEHPFIYELKELSTTNEPATVCDALVPPLVAQLFGHMQAYASLDTFNDIMSKLSGMLQEELKGRDIHVNMSPHHVLWTV